ncbi:MAG: glucose 1-dehydrogenase [Paracoccaceae bacterium]|nr:glucose 1-dehydrogenase [Paracoccaceae bacterium]
MALDGKTALVTGAGSGIGAATAIELAKAGANVAAADLDANAANETAKRTGALGQRGLAIQADIGNLSDIDAMVSTVVGELGGIDIVVNNAGVTRHGALLDITEETWDLMQNINAKGTFFCVQRVARQMVEQGRGGRIINMSSTGGKGFRGTSSPAYAASKGAIISMTYIAAVQLAPHDINVNAICPGLVDTPMLRGMLAQRSNDTGTPVQQLFEGLENMVPLGRLDDPEDVAAMAAFLAGPGGRNITGQTINIDGGLVMN